MKKYIKSLFLVIFAVALIYSAKSVSVKAEEISYTTPYYGIVKNQNVFIYADASDVNPAVGTAEYGWVVDVIGYDNVAKYYKVRYYRGNVNNCSTGYIKDMFLNVTAAPFGEKFSTVYGYIGISKYDNVDVRSTGNVKDVIAIIPKDTKVTIVGSSSSWYQVKIKVNGVVRVGYVYKGLLTPVDALNKYITLSYSKKLVRGRNYKITVKDLSPVALAKTVTWKTSNKKVCTITKSGTFKIKKRGNCTLTCQIKCGTRTRTIKLKLKSNATYKVTK